jgi:hypothetical protein
MLSKNQIATLGRGLTRDQMMATIANSRRCFTCSEVVTKPDYGMKRIRAGGIGMARNRRSRPIPRVSRCSLSAWRLVLQVGSGRADPARAHRASGLNISGRASTNFFRAGLNRAHLLKYRPSTALKHDGLLLGSAGPGSARN